MQKLLALPLKSISNYFLQKHNVSVALPFFLRFIAIILIVHSASVLYQFNDLIRLDYVSSDYSFFHFSLFNLFKYISISFAKPLLVISLISSVGLFFYILPFWALLLNFIVFNSIVVLFPTFMSFQWDFLLLEVLFFSLFLVPPVGRLNLNIPMLVSYLRLLPFILLIVRLFYHSGLVKILSNDYLWLSQDVLNFHLFSQPMPHFLSYYIHLVVLKFNLSSSLTQLMFVFELVLPFALLLTQYRRFAAFGLIFFQFAIILTGNYGYFNFLVIAMLSIPFFISATDDLIDFKPLFHRFNIVISTFLILCIFNSMIVVFKSSHVQPLFKSSFARLSLFNPYGLFANMTTNQTRFTIRLSYDGIIWHPIHLKYFDSNGFPALHFVQPYHPRIRWQLWFKFLNEYQYPKWYENFVRLIAEHPNSLSTIVSFDNTLGRQYNFVELCYQDIIFNIDSNHKPSKFWVPIKDSSCHRFDAKKNSFYLP